MPWFCLPMKDAQGCDNRRVGATILWSGGVRMRKLFQIYIWELGCKTVRLWWIDSNQRGYRLNWNISVRRGKENKCDFASSGERKRKSLNLVRRTSLKIYADKKRINAETSVKIRDKSARIIRLILWMRRCRSPMWDYLFLVEWSGMIDHRKWESCTRKEKVP